MAMSGAQQKTDGDEKVAVGERRSFFLGSWLCPVEEGGSPIDQMAHRPPTTVRFSTRRAYIGMPQCVCCALDQTIDLLPCTPHLRDGP